MYVYEYAVRWISLLQLPAVEVWIWYKDVCHLAILEHGTLSAIRFYVPFCAKTVSLHDTKSKLWLFWNTILIRIWWFDQKSFFRILLCQLMWVRVMAPRRDSLPLPHRCASAAGLRRFGFGVPSFQEIHFHGWNCPMSKQIVAPRRSEVFNIQCYLTWST